MKPEGKAATALEPLLEWTEIQGNILAGFNKDHQRLLGFSFSAGRDAVKKLVARLTDRITTLREAHGFKKARKARMMTEGVEPSNMKAVWTAIAFSFDGLRFLTSSAEQFTDAEFRQGLSQSAIRLGDPSGSVSKWIVGGDRNPDLFLIIAADDPNELTTASQEVIEESKVAGLSLLYDETGHDLGYYSDQENSYPSGHEHFGFKDGISQPGIRGVLPDGSFLTPRTVANDPDDTKIEYAAPGQALVCAGQFVLGYSRQVDTFPRLADKPIPLSPEPNAIAPAWARNGSFLVFRRLQQDVAAFRQFNASRVLQLKGVATAERLAALLVGRWPSGASLIRSFVADDPSQAAPEVINAFAYSDENAVFSLAPDDDGRVCPIAAHIRKVNPRDNNTDIGFASATLTKRILRRGIPYGRPLPPDVTEDVPGDRGLLFLSYQSSISNQFEFLCSRWMNSSTLPRNPSEHPEGLGFDMVVGQKQSDRVRFAYLRPSDSGADDQQISNETAEIKDWVVATGGGYFFAPSLSALKSVLAS